VMKSPVLTVGPEATLEEAYKLLLERGIRHLPVVEEGRLVGIVTDRDIRLATSHLNPKGPCPGCTRVGEVMTREVVTAHPLDPVEEAARVMRERKIGCLPVLEDEALVGIVTGIDLLDALLRLTGVTEPRSSNPLLAISPKLVIWLVSPVDGAGGAVMSASTVRAEYQPSPSDTLFCRKLRSVPISKVPVRSGLRLALPGWPNVAACCPLNELMATVRSFANGCGN